MENLKFTPPGALSTLAFEAIVAFVIVSFIYATFVANRRVGTQATKRTMTVAIGSILWLSLASLIVASGLLREKPFPAILVFFLVGNGLALVVALSPIGRRIALGISLPALVGFQAFRLPLELVLHAWVRAGVIPETMTWTGRNFDIVSGILALVAAPLVNRFRGVGWLFNVVGFVLLLNVMRVSLLSLPLPFAWKVDPPLQLVFHLPFALIAPVCVAGALAGHIILTRALLMKKDRLG